MIPCKYSDYYNFHNGLAQTVKASKYGFIDKIGTLVIPCEFDVAMNFSDGLACVKQNGKYGYIDPAGSFAVPCIFDEAEDFSEGLAPVMQDGKWGYIDHTGKFVIPRSFDKAQGFAEGLAPVMQDGKWGYINHSGAFVIPCRFDYAFKFNESRAEVKQDARYGYIDLAGNAVIPCKFEWVLPFREGLAGVKRNGKYGFIDKSGNLVIPCQFESAWNFFDNVAKVRLDKRWVFIDRHGNVYNDKRSAVAAIYPEIKEQQKWLQPFPAFIAAELGSFDAYLASKSISPLTPEAVQAQVEKEIAAWQQKGEFESTAKWQERVNEQTRADKARELAAGITGDYNKRLDAVRAEYRSKYESLAREYCDYHAKKFADGDMTLKPYDADNQTFLISTTSYGDILLPVPFAEAPSFKSGWESTKKNAVATFVPSGDNIAISSVRFGKYVYDSNTKATYTSVDVDYNFRPIDLAALDYNFGEIGSAGTAAPVSTPAAKAVAPRTYTPEHRKVTAGATSDIDTDIPTGSRKAPSTFAVIIANGDYAHASQVANAAADGRAVEQYLTRTLGIPAQNVTTYVNATYGQMASAMSHLRDIAAAYGEGNFSVLFYYVGHGLPDDTARESYILPVDVDPRNTEICYPLDRLYTQLGSLGASRVTVMVDACFSGANHGDGMLVPQSMGVTIKPKAASPSGNMIVLSAAEGDETAFPYAAKGHGLFTYWLLKKIRDTRGEVTLGELSDYVMENVRKTSVVENRKPQTPTVATSPSLTATWRSLPLAQ